MQEIIEECQGNYYDPESEGCAELIAKVHKVTKYSITKKHQD